MSVQAPIPKLFHQIWFQGAPPPLFESLSQTWKDKNPGWKLMQWEEKGMEKFIRDNFPEYLELYLSYNHWIYKVDFFRYFAIYYYGGVFIDMDFECLKGIDDLLLLFKGAQVAFPAECSDNKTLLESPESHENNFLVSVPKHPFWQIVFNELKREHDGVFSWPESLKAVEEVMKRTGPFVLTRSLKQFPKERMSEIFVIPSEYLFPLSWNEAVLPKFKHDMNALESVHSILRAKNLPNEPFAVHYWMASWVDSQATEQYLVEKKPITEVTFSLSK